MELDTVIRKLAAVVVAGLTSACGAEPAPAPRGELKQSASTLTPCDTDTSCPSGSRCHVLLAREGTLPLCFGNGQSPCDYLDCPTDYPTCYTYLSLPSQWTCVRMGP